MQESTTEFGWELRIGGETEFYDPEQQAKQWVTGIEKKRKGLWNGQVRNSF